MGLIVSWVNGRDFWVECGWLGSRLLVGGVFLWRGKVVFFCGVVAGFLVVENTMTFFLSLGE